MTRNRAFAGAIVLASVLAGCLGQTSSEGVNLFRGLTPGGSLNGKPQPNIRKSAEMLGGRITVSGPDGYCIDPTSLSSTKTSGFSLLASCNILSGGTHSPIVEPALVTITARSGDTSKPSFDALAGSLGTNILIKETQGNAVFVQMASGGENAFGGADPKHWRGAFSINGIAIALALYAPEGSPLTGRQGLAFLSEVKSRVKSTDNAAVAEAVIDADDRTGLATRLGRLFARRDLP